MIRIFAMWFLVYNFGLGLSTMKGVEVDFAIGALLFEISTVLLICGLWCAFMSDNPKAKIFGFSVLCLKLPWWLGGMYWALEVFEAHPMWLMAGAGYGLAVTAAVWSWNKGRLNSEAKPCVVGVI